MADIQLGAHNIRSHGINVAKFHKHDWIILVLLAIIDIILNVIEPYHRFVGEYMMTDLRYPMKSNTVPFWAVPLIAVVLPIFIITSIYFKKRNVYDLHNAILGLLFSVLITAVLTDAIKDAVGRPRPDFFWRCFPDGNAKYDNFTTSVLCHGEKSVIKEGHKSFPSGHSSWSFAGLGFLSWYLAGKIRAFDKRGHVAKLCIVLLPLLCAALIAISRVDDYWHHWQDVFTGGSLGMRRGRETKIFLVWKTTTQHNTGRKTKIFRFREIALPSRGLVVSSVCYLQFFPPPYDEDGWGPHAYFRVLAETLSTTTASTTTNTLNTTGPAEMDTIYIASDGQNPFASRDSSPMFNGLEAGVGARRH